SDSVASAAVRGPPQASGALGTLKLAACGDTNGIDAPTAAAGAVVLAATAGTGALEAAAGMADGAASTVPGSNSASMVTSPTGLEYRNIRGMFSPAMDVTRCRSPRTASSKLGH